MLSIGQSPIIYKGRRVLSRRKKGPHSVGDLVASEQLVMYRNGEDVLKNEVFGVPSMEQWVKNLTSVAWFTAEMWFTP